MGAALVLIIGWTLVEPRASYSVEAIGDVLFPTILLAAAFISARLARREREREEERHMAALEELAKRDELSGLHNYRFLRETLRFELGEAAERKTQLAVIMLDLNDFKTVNDRFGHQAGDALIAAIGRAVDNEVRGRGIVARYGGDEFTVLLPDTDCGGAHDVAASVAKAIEDASLGATTANQHLRVTASYGIAVYPNDAPDAEALIAHADRALYEAKAQLMDVRSRSEERHAQDVFFAIGDAISSSLDPEMLVKNLVRSVATTLELDTCSVWLVAPDDTLLARAFFVSDADLPRRVNEASRVQPMTRAEAVNRGLITDRTTYVDDVSQSKVLGKRFRELLEPDTWMITVPLQGSRDGVLMMTARHEFSAPLATSLAEAIARLASAALQNAETYARAHRQADQLRDLAGLGGLLLGEGSYEERLRSVVKRVAEVTGCDMLTLDTEDPTGAVPFAREFYGRAPDGGEFDEDGRQIWLAARPALTEQPVVEFLAKVTEPIVMYDPINEVPEFYRQVIITSGTRTVVVMPVIWQGDLKALFYFASYRERAFDEHDIALMQSIAAQIGPAVEVASLNVKLGHSYEELKEAHREAIERLAFAAEARDPYTGRHLQRIGQLSEAIARRMGFDQEGVESVGYAAVVHDLGKLKIPDEILTKPGELTDEDWAAMRMHPEFGAELLGQGLFYDVARTVALHHHERWDGSGYPFGLKGEDIPLEARIVAVADVYDALISARPYKHAWPRERALAELLMMRGVKLCPKSIDVFLQLWTEGEISKIEAATQESSFEADFRGRRAA